MTGRPDPRARLAASPQPGLPAFLDSLVDNQPDDRPAPSLGLGDPDAAALLLATTRAVLLAATEKEVITAVACFGLGVGGRMVRASEDQGTALPLDITFGTGPPVLFDVEVLSLARMRLEQFLPTLLEDARTAIARLHHLEELQGASGTDPLTGLLSRRELMRRLPLVGTGDVLCLLDIDNFTAINHRYGHVGGDLVLRDLGRLIRASIRGNDCAGRYGGDEIVILFKTVREAAAVERLGLLQQLWEKTVSETVTFSAGAASLDDEGWQLALARADAAMYLAKERGRNRCGGHGGSAS